ncbi:MAG: tyrosine-type recombinase/integrase, partial [Candidatus Obscuribacterales bacterium]|nr:tyrosine-type recombinase/integrase [Candidatus Obscuribacterales bacterium]
MHQMTTDSVPTLRMAWQDFKRLRPLKPRTTDDYDKRLRQVDDWLDLPINQITRSMVVERFDEIKQRSESHANLIMKVLSSVLSYASARYEYADGQPMLAANPVKVLKGLRLWNRVSRRQTIINTCDLAKWWQAVQSLDKQGHSLGRDVLVVLLLTGMRKAEAARLRWGDIDFSNDSILIRDTKNGTDHQIPMGKYLRDFLWNRRLAQRHNNAACEYVFPGKDLTGHVKSIENAIERVTAQSG